MCTTSFISINTFGISTFKMLMHSPLRSHFYLSYLILPVRIILHTKNWYHTHAMPCHAITVSFGCRPFRYWSRTKEIEHEKIRPNDFQHSYFFSSKITIHFQLNLIRLQYTIALWCVGVCAYTEDTKEPDGIIVEMKTNGEKNIIALNDIELNVKRRKMKPRQTTSLIEWGTFDTSPFSSLSWFFWLYFVVSPAALFFQMDHNNLFC